MRAGLGERERARRDIHHSTFLLTNTSEVIKEDLAGAAAKAAQVTREGRGWGERRRE